MRYSLTRSNQGDVMPHRIFMQDQKAVTSVEYALVASVMALALISSASHIGGHLSAIFTTLASAL